MLREITLLALSAHGIRRVVDDGRSAITSPSPAGDIISFASSRHHFLLCPRPRATNKLRKPLIRHLLFLCGADRTPALFVTSCLHFMSHVCRQIACVNDHRVESC